MASLYHLSSFSVGFKINYYYPKSGVAAILDFEISKRLTELFENGEIDGNPPINRQLEKLNPNQNWVFSRDSKRHIFSRRLEPLL